MIGGSESERVPVVDLAGRPIGVISKTDLLRRNQAHERVVDLMTPMSFVLHSDGSGAQALYAAGPCGQAGAADPGAYYVRMDGRHIFKFAAYTLGASDLRIIALAAILTALLVAASFIAALPRAGCGTRGGRPGLRR